MKPSIDYQMTLDDFNYLQKMVKWVGDGRASIKQIETFSGFFRDRAIPVDGRVSADESILSFALRSKCESLALSLLDHPTLAPTPSSRGLIEKCLWSARVMQKLIDTGYPVRAELRADQNMMPNILMNGGDKIISILAKHGLPLDQFHIVSKQCTLPYATLLYTADNSNNGNVLALLEAGSKPDVCDRVGDTFLHKVLKNRSEKRADWIDTNYIDGFRKLLKHCVEKKIPIDVVNREGESALHVAARRGYINSVMALLESGANPALENDRGCTPAYLAKVAGFRDIEQALHVRTVHQRIQDLLDENGLGRAAPATAHANV